MEILFKVLQFILSLSLLIFIHELGHFLSARMFGIRVEKFYLFFDAGGFSLFKFKRGDTTYGMGWIPLGGYVKISGMVDESLDTEALKQPAQPWEFRSKPAWQRLIVMVAGVVMNVLAAIVIYTGMSWHWGDRYIDNSDLRWGYTFNELGHRIGFEDGDRIVALDGKAAEGDFQTIYPDMVIDRIETVTVERNGARVDIPIPVEFVSEMINSADFMIPRVPSVVMKMIPDGGAALGGMMPGDSLVAFDGRPMIFTDQFQKALAASKGRDAVITVARDSAGVRVLRDLTIRISDEGLLGVNFATILGFAPVQTLHYNLLQAVPAGFHRAGTQIASYWNNLKLIFTPKTKAYQSVGSIISIGNIFHGYWDWQSFWAVTAFLSIVLAVMNILPIPALDGGHVLFLLWEVVTRRKPSDKFLEWAQIVGLVLLFALIAFAFGNDIYRFFIK